ncbi:hypothetical protein T492DRAFT_863173 [Pavlovales sp. CCMP2436]|nr:hypothetical protein T492DRAFT_863173 [Pavlovales sp. CCMP2436]
MRLNRLGDFCEAVQTRGGSAPAHDRATSPRDFATPPRLAVSRPSPRADPRRMAALATARLCALCSTEIRAVDAFKLRGKERISADDVYDILVYCAQNNPHAAMMLTWLLQMETVGHPHGNLPAFQSAVGVALQSIFPITNAYWYVRISGWMRVQWGLASDFELAVLETLLYTMYTANGEFPGRFT